MTRIIDAFRALAWLGLVCVALAVTTPPAAAGVNTWTNASSDLAWNNTSVDWNSPTIWNNANADDAVFGAAGAGTITVSSPITVHGIYFTTAGYTRPTRRMITTFGARTLAKRLRALAAARVP